MIKFKYIVFYAHSKGYGYTTITRKRIKSSECVKNMNDALQKHKSIKDVVYGVSIINYKFVGICL